jgi:tetratricopeptide (TPR) repeat protein
MGRVQFLLDAKRYTDAEAALREALAAAPDDGYLHALLALALFHQDREADALQEAEAAIGLAPNLAFAHYMQAVTLLALDRLPGALTAAREALRLDPRRAAYHAVVSRVHVRRKRWQAALEAAEAGLRAEPESVECANLCGLALANLGRRGDATEVVAGALARDPLSASTHATHGWVSLHRGDPRGALEHFREALRLNPMSGWARAGIVEALKARNPVYRLLLRYFLWISRLTEEERVGFAMASAGVRSTLRAAARMFPLLYIVVWPLFLLYFLFVMLTWVARPLFALLLRFDPLGRLALPREEVVASNWMAVCLVSTLVGLILGPVLGLVLEEPRVAAAFLTLAALGLAMTMPVAGVFRCPWGLGRGLLISYTVLLALAGLGAFALTWVGSWALAGASILLVAFGVGWVLYIWIANLVILVVARWPQVRADLQEK